MLLGEEGLPVGVLAVRGEHVFAQLKTYGREHWFRIDSYGSGKLARVQDDFEAFHPRRACACSARPLEATGARRGGGRFVVRDSEDGIQICSYGAPTREPRVLRTLPLARLEGAIHVDEKANLLYVVHEGVLFRTRLRE